MQNQNKSGIKTSNKTHSSHMIRDGRMNELILIYELTFHFQGNVSSQELYS